METVQGKSGPPIGAHAGWERAEREGRVSSKICHQQYYTWCSVSIFPLSIRDYVKPLQHMRERQRQCFGCQRLCTEHVIHCQLHRNIKSRYTHEHILSVTTTKLNSIHTPTQSLANRHISHFPNFICNYFCNLLIYNF